jgi:hypothetical protein
MFPQQLLVSCPVFKLSNTLALSFLLREEEPRSRYEGEEREFEKKEEVTAQGFHMEAL